MRTLSSCGQNRTFVSKISDHAEQDLFRCKRPFDRKHRYVECRQRQSPSEVVRTVHGIDDKTVLGLPCAESSLIALFREQHTGGKLPFEIPPYAFVGGEVKRALDVSFSILPP